MKRKVFLEFIHNHLVQWTLVGLVLLNIVNWAIVALAIRPSDIPILLRYNVFLGLDFDSLSPWYAAYTIPSMALLFVVLHVLVAFLLFSQRDRIAAHIFLVSGIIVQMVALIASASVILINR